MDEPPKLEFEDRNNKFMNSDYVNWALNLSGAFNATNSIFDIRGNNLNWSKKCKLFKSGIIEMNDLQFEDIVPKSIYDYIDKSVSTDEQAIMHFLTLNSTKGSSGFSVPIQRNYVDKDESLIHRMMMEKYLSDYSNGPIYMYDFETANLAIPFVNGSKPYEQIVYQFSVHVILNPNDFDFDSKRNVIHYEWLADDKETFHLDAWNEFVKVFEKHGEGVYVAWNDSFEKGCIKRAMMNWDFDSEVENWMERIANETIDLMIPFKHKFYYHKDLKGSYSIKYAGPHFASEINYNDLPLVKRGDQSAAVAKSWLRDDSEESNEIWKKSREGMLKYCEYDTLLMVAILQRVKERIG